MKKIFIITLLAVTTTTFANTASHFKFDEVDSIIANGKSVLIEDLRDGFDSIKGVQVKEESVLIYNNSNALILLKNSSKPARAISISARAGGDMGGG